MKPLTNAEIAVLSLLVEKDRHGYEIEEIGRASCRERVLSCV
jgi:DNA-binding PadR family transcriptional regulator